MILPATNSSLFPTSVPFLNDTATPPAGGATVGKRYPTIPMVSRISFDFLHYIRPPREAGPAPEEAFDQLVNLLTTWDCGAEVPRRTKERLRVNLLRNLCHVFYFSCQQVSIDSGARGAGRMCSRFARLNNYPLDRWPCVTEGYNSFYIL